MTLLKSLVLRTLPDPLLACAKRFRYPRMIREFRSPHESVLTAIIQPGDHVLDIGANIGWYTRMFSDLVGPTGRVFSVEPVPATFRLLSYCTGRLGLANVELFNCAVADRPGSAVMEVPKYPTGGDNFYAARIVDRAAANARIRTLTVPVTSIDLLFGERLSEVAFLKCDVEGHELAVVRGALASLARWKPALLVEVSGDPDEPQSSSSTLIDALAGLGYGSYRFDGAGMARRQPGQRAVDYFFLTDEHARILRRAAVRVS